MTMRMRLGAGVAVMALMGGQAGAAVTPEQVWQSWAEYYAAAGQAVSVGATQREGDTLTLSNVLLSSGSAEDKATSLVTIPVLTLRDIGNGTVDASIPQPITIETKAEGAEGKPVMTKGDVTMTGQAITVSGNPDAMSYDVKVASTLFKLNEIVADGEAVPMALSVGLTDSSGVYQVSKSAGQRITSALKAKSIEMTSSGVDPDSGSKFDSTFKAVDPVFDSTTVLPEGTGFDNIAAALKGGMTTEGTFRLGPGHSTVSFLDQPAAVEPTAGAGAEAAPAEGAAPVENAAPGGVTEPPVEGEAAPAVEPSGSGTMTFDDEGSSGSFRMSAEGLTFDLAGNAGKGTASFVSMPFPIDFAYKRIGMGMTTPVSAAETAAPYGLRMEFAGLTLSEGVWSMFDPAKHLPRDAIDLSVNLGGLAKLHRDLFDPAQMSSEAEPMPFEFQTLDITNVALSALGASVTAKGALKFLPAPAMPMQGMDGMSGMQGMGGMQGMDGMQGMGGMSGMGGMQGMGGMGGMDGMQGMGGMQGMDGMSGMQGMSGMDGMSGMQGMDGMSGMQGMGGMQGMDGMSGMQGMDGMDGMDGMSGMQGMDGMSGMQGMDDGGAAEQGVLPVGTIEAKAKGLNSLMDKLSAMGLMSPEDLQGARMMLMMFSVADGADGLTSKVEFREDGGVYVNGQRVQ